MRYLLILSVFILTQNSFAQEGILWGPEIQVSDGTIYGNYRPRATIVQGDIPIVIYGSTGMENVFISRWNGLGFDSPNSIIPVNNSSYIADWTGPDIASKGDTVIAVFKLNPIDVGNVYSVRSTNGGLVFTDTIRVDNHDSGTAWMPSLDLDDNGNPLVTYMAHDGAWANPRYVLANSLDAGITYNPETEPVTLPGETCDCCPAEIIIDGQRQLMLFRNNEGNIRDIHGVLSLDGGTTFPYQENLDQLAWNIMGCPSTGSHGVFVGNKLITTYASAGEGIYKVYVSSSDVSSNLSFLNRLTMLSPVLGNDTQNFPRISNDNDTIVMAWEEKESGNKDIYYSLAFPGLDVATSLTSTKWRANSTTVGIQTNPEIIYKNGIVHLFFSENSSGDLIYRRGVINPELNLEELSQLAKIYPNPSIDGSFELNNVQEITTLTNAIGEKVEFKLQQSGSSFNLELINTNNGVYFLSYLDMKGDRKVQKLVVQ